VATLLTPWGDSPNTAPDGVLSIIVAGRYSFAKNPIIIDGWEVSYNIGIERISNLFDKHGHPMTIVKVDRISKGKHTISIDYGEEYEFVVK